MERHERLVVRFSRHAKRRAKLYDISEATVQDVVKDLDPDDGEHHIVKEFSGFKFPIKMVVTVEHNIAKVLTVYPLKKGRR